MSDEGSYLWEKGYESAEKWAAVEIARLNDQIRGAREFVLRHPSLTETDRAEFEAFLKVGAATRSLDNR
jgi:hypothetical protein